MSTERHRDGTGWEESADYSRAVRRGRHIHVSGTTAGSVGGDVIAGGVGEQTEAALRSAFAAVSALGGPVEDVVRTRVMLVPGADWEEAAAAYRDLLGHIAPANTMVYVHSLIGDGFLVEVEMEAVLGS